MQKFSPIILRRDCQTDRHIDPEVAFPRQTPRTGGLPLDGFYPSRSSSQPIIATVSGSQRRVSSLLSPPPPPPPPPQTWSLIKPLAAPKKRRRQLMVCAPGAARAGEKRA